MVENKTIGEIVADIKNKKAALQDNTIATKNNGSVITDPGWNYTPESNRNEQGVFKVTPIKYDVNPLAIYDRLNDGSYVAKYKNYIGAEGNENRLAQEQSTTEQWVNGIAKNSRKMGNYMIDATVGTVAGLFNAVGSGDFQDFWDNDVSNSLDDWNKQLDYQLPNYYSDEQKSMGVLESMGTANFWANDVAGGFAFVGGALLPELAIGILTGGASIPTSLAKLGFKTAGKSLLKNFGDDAVKAVLKNGDNVLKGSADDFIKAEYAIASKDLVRAANVANYSASAGKILNTSRFLLQSSAFEASMETRHNFHEAVDNFYANFEELNGVQPTYEESQDFIKSAVNGANGVFAANMGILMVSNAVMFGKRFNLFPTLGKNVNNFGNKIIGLGVAEKAGVITMQTANKAQKIVGNTYKVLNKPMIEGLYEEGLQGVAGSAMQNYLEAKYNPKLEGAYSLSAAIGDAFSHQYTSKEGWKEITIGMLIGFSAGKLQKGGSFTGLGKDSYSTQRKGIQKDVELANQSRKGLSTRMLDATTLNNFAKQVESESENSSINNVQATMATAQYIQNQESIRSHKQIAKDYKAVVENMTLTEEQEEAIGGKENISEYKQQLLNHFDETLTDYKFASKTVENLGLNKSIEMTKGNKAEVGQYMMMSFMAGKGALQSVKNIGEQLDSLIGTTGAFSAIEHYNGLTVEQKQKSEERKKKQRKIKDLEKSTRLLATQIAGVQTSGRQFSEEKKKERYNKMSTQYTTLLDEKQRLTEELEELDEALNSNYDAENTDVKGTLNVEGKVGGIADVFETLDKIEDYVASLKKVGKNKEAATIENMIAQAKDFSDSHREANNAFRSMLDTDFFKKKSSLARRIVGSKYKMSDEFKEIIKDNSEVIDKALKALGERGEEKISQRLDVLIEGNNEISDREKYRLESLIRLQLGYERLALKISDIVENTDTITTEKDVEENPNTKDTIAVKKKLNIKDRDFSNLDIINQTIEDISNEISLVQEIATQNSKTKNIRKKLDTNARKEVEIEGQLGEYAAVNKLVEKITIQDDTTEFTPEEQQLQVNYPKLIEQQLEKEQLEKELSETSMDGIIKKEEYQQYYDLLKKKQKEGLEEEETEELLTLETLIDSWTQLTGTLVDDIRISDLLEQKIILENERPAETLSYEEASFQEIIDSNEFTVAAERNNYSLTQFYDTVTATKTKEGKIEISGISYDVLREAVGFDFEYEKDSRGNIVIEDNINDNNSIRNRINAAGRVALLPTNDDLTTNYSIVLETTNDMSEKGTALKPMNSTHKEDIGKKMEAKNVYNLQEGEEVFLEIDPNDGWNKEKLAEYKEDKDLKVLKASVLIRVVNKENKLVGVLKGKRNGENKSANDLKFETLRDSVVEDDKFTEKYINGDSKTSFKIENSGIKVKQVLLGHPNFNFVLLEKGKVAVDYVKVNAVNKDKIGDFGFAEKGKIRTNSQTGEVNTTFIQRQIERSGGSKVPFIVLNVGGKRIAYPVKLDVKNKPNAEEFEKIYNSAVDPVTKTNNLNKFLAVSGIDIQKAGNSFVAIGTKNNLKDEFFEEKLAQVKSIEYFSDINTWADKNTKVNDILDAGISVNLDLSKPFHSPKMVLDYGQVSTKQSKATPKKKTSKPKEMGSGAKAFLNNAKENGTTPASTKELNDNC